MCLVLHVRCTNLCVQVAGAVAGLLELLDIIALASDSFDIIGGFKASWRAHVWEGECLFE